MRGFGPAHTEVRLATPCAQRRSEPTRTPVVEARQISALDYRSLTALHKRRSADGTLPAWTTWIRRLSLMLRWNAAVRGPSGSGRAAQSCSGIEVGRFPSKE